MDSLKRDQPAKNKIFRLFTTHQYLGYTLNIDIYIFFKILYVFLAIWTTFASDEIMRECEVQGEEINNSRVDGT